MRMATKTSTTIQKRKPSAPQRILAVDVGGTKVKILASGATDARKMPSGPELTPLAMVKQVKQLAKGWKYEAVSIGLPARIGANGPLGEPGNLGPGWVGFDFTGAFRCPVRMANDAAMQALGGYEGGRMMFLGLGTGLGSALIVEHIIITLELGDLPFRDSTLNALLARRSLEKVGKKTWRKWVAEAVPPLQKAFQVDYIVLGGGNAKHMKLLPPGVRVGNNLTAFRGGFRLWGMDDVQTLDAHGLQPPASRLSLGEWRLF